METNSDMSVSPLVDDEDVELHSPPENVRNRFKELGPVGFSLRGGAADDGENEADDTDNEVEPGNDDGDDEEEVEMGKAALGGKMVDEDEEDVRRRRRRRIVIMLCLAFVAFVVILGVVFSVGAVPLGRTVIDSPEPTSTPTTLSPTPSPITSTPTTVSPTASPIAPTFSGDSPLSSKTCPEISADLEDDTPGTPFKDTHTKPDGALACGDTYAGFDPERPNRNVWTARVGRKDCVLHDFEGGTQTCEEVGARRCTADELQFGAAQGSGCGGDDFLLYTSTPCSNEGAPGIFLINLSLKKNDTFFECETNLSRTTITRCCADFVIA